MSMPRDDIHRVQRRVEMVEPVPVDECRYRQQSENQRLQSAQSGRPLRPESAAIFPARSDNRPARYSRNLSAIQAKRCLSSRLGQFRAVALTNVARAQMPDERCAMRSAICPTSASSDEVLQQRKLSQIVTCLSDRCDKCRGDSIEVARLLPIAASKLNEPKSAADINESTGMGVELPLASPPGRGAWPFHPNAGLILPGLRSARKRRDCQSDPGTCPARRSPALPAAAESPARPARLTRAISASRSSLLEVQDHIAGLDASPNRRKRHVHVAAGVEHGVSEVVAHRDSCACQPSSAL